LSSYFGNDKENILDNSLSTIAAQVDVIQGLLTANKRLSEALSAATREIKRLTEKAETSRNNAVM
jgi:hypothetical protein